MSFAAPTMASVGHAWMHSVQPMHAASSMRAIIGAVVTPQVSSIANAGVSNNLASAAIVVSPPGGQRLIAASPAATASAYARQLS